jgi:hypothetical protein
MTFGEIKKAVQAVRDNLIERVGLYLKMMVMVIVGIVKDRRKGKRGKAR